MRCSVPRLHTALPSDVCPEGSLYRRVSPDVDRESCPVTLGRIKKTNTKHSGHGYIYLFVELQDLEKSGSEPTTYKFICSFQIVPVVLFSNSFLHGPVAYFHWTQCEFEPRLVMDGWRGKKKEMKAERLGEIRRKRKEIREMKRAREKNGFLLETKIINSMSRKQR